MEREVPFNWPHLGEVLGLPERAHRHLPEITRFFPLRPGEELQLRGGGGCADLVCVTRGRVRLQERPGITHLLGAVPEPMQPFQLHGRSEISVMAQEASHLVQVDGAGLAHLAAWERWLAELGEGDVKRRMALVRRPLLLRGVPPFDLPMLIESMQLHEYDRPRTLVRQGAPCEILYLMAEGRGELSRDGQRVGEVREGDLFPTATLDAACCDMTVTTRAPTRLYALFKRDLDALKALAVKRPALCASWCPTR